MLQEITFQTTTKKNCMRPRHPKEPMKNPFCIEQYLLLSPQKPPAVYTLIGKIIFTLFVLLNTASRAQAQQDINYAVHANIIYRFTKYIDWPEDKRSDDFIIGIVGDTPLYDELKSFVSNKTAGGRKIVVTKFLSSATSFNCQILFIADAESASLKKIVTRIANAPILLVSESEGLAHKGSCINFITVQERLKLEINKTNIEQHNLGVATELLNLGVLIK